MKMNVLEKYSAPGTSKIVEMVSSLVFHSFWLLGRSIMIFVFIISKSVI